MPMPARPLSEPVPDQLGLVARSVVHDDMAAKSVGAMALAIVGALLDLAGAHVMHARGKLFRFL